VGQERPLGPRGTHATSLDNWRLPFSSTLKNFFYNLTYQSTHKGEGHEHRWTLDSFSLVSQSISDGG
jgi:hypothetical protein